jgi:hypothetical protein
MQKLTWNEPREIAKLLCKTNPRIDVLSMTDDILMDMMEREHIAEHLPPIDSTKKQDIMFMIKCAITYEMKRKEECGYE